MYAVTSLPPNTVVANCQLTLTRKSDNLVWTPASQTFAPPPTAAANSTQPVILPGLALVALNGCPSLYLAKDSNVTVCPSGDAYIATIVSTVDNSLVAGPLLPGASATDPGQPLEASLFIYPRR